MPKNDCSEEEKNQVWPFSWLQFLFLLVFNLNFCKHGCNGREDEPCFAMRIVHVFVHACEHSYIAFARRMGKFCNLKLGYETMGLGERNKWVKKQMYVFQD